MKFDINNPNLFQTYDLFLKNSFGKPFWVGGVYINQRIFWTNGELAKSDLETFHNPGIYIWGYDKTPLYIGKAEVQTLAKRFSRYIFQTKSQCKVAEKYSAHLKYGGEIKTIEGLKKEYDISRARAKGAKAFGEVGSNKIWFILIPLEKEKISVFENKLIEVGFLWNYKNGFDGLINKARPNK